MTEILPEYTTHTNEDGSIEQNFLTTYSEEERQEAKINKANAGLLFTPEFIPFYPAVKKQYGLTDKEAILYGFIRFYLTSNERARFYFTNEQLAEILDCDIKTISRAIAKLEDVKIITTSRKMRANGGQIRFISGFTPTGQNVVLQKDKNGMLRQDKNGMLQRDIHGMVIDNKIKKNNKKDIIYIPGFDKRPTKPPNNKASTQFEELWQKYPAKDGKKAAYRFFLSSVHTEQDRLDINTALNNYLQSEKVKKGFIKNGSTWFNNWRDWIEAPNSNGKKAEIDAVFQIFRKNLQEREQKQ